LTKDDFICPICGGTEVGIRNGYKNQPEGTIGFVIEEYCKKCGVTVSNIPHILNNRDKLQQIVKRLNNKTMEEIINE